jgi:ribonuclease H2 subunit A
MVYGAAWCPESRKDDLAKLGFADSKVLTAETRTKLLAALKGSDYIGWIADVISPETMSAKMTRRYKYNLNAISHDSAIGMIQSALDQNVKLRHVFLDTVGDPQRYEDKLRTVFPGIGFTVSKKADSLVRARVCTILSDVAGGHLTHQNPSSSSSHPLLFFSSSRSYPPHQSWPR